uniref:Uncharacterized protein n=1 Tax=Thermodesulfobacterium geofontis TaxID=1295609 RepID=A0A7C4NW45_9BACT
MKRKNRGYVLLIVLIISVLIALIGAGLAFMSKQGYLSTRGNILFNKLQKAAHYGINEAIRRIVVHEGICEEGIISETLNIDGAEVTVSTSRRGLLCSLRAEANLGGARQVIVASTQGFYGIGTFTVKANERVVWRGGAYVSGCDSQNNCNIPGIIVSGPITGVPAGTARTCDQSGTVGIFGSPPLKPNVRFYDLVPLTFNVNCFYELLNMFETEDNYLGYPMGLGENPFWRDEDNNPRQDIIFNKCTNENNCTSCPNPLITDEPEVVWNRRLGSFTIRSWSSEIPSIPGSCEVDGNNLNLSNDLPDCTWIRVTNATVNITGVAPNIKFIYAPSATVTVSNAGNAIIISNRSI